MGDLLVVLCSVVLCSGAVLSGAVLWCCALVLCSGAVLSAAVRICRDRRNSIRETLPATSCESTDVVFVRFSTRLGQCSQMLVYAIVPRNETPLGYQSGREIDERLPSFSHASNHQARAQW